MKKRAVAVTPVILCGGIGSRLWPLSTADRPKQFLPLDGRSSMLNETAARLRDEPSLNLAFSNFIIVGNQRHRQLIRKEVPGARLLLEPFGRNSAAAIAAASLAAEPDALLLVMPADHAIEFPERLREAIAKGVPAASCGKIVTFGIQPDHPATGYGYIDAEPAAGPVLKARSFVEKPALATAKAYLEAGHYFWNAGIFLFRADTMLAAFRQFAPDVLASVERAFPVRFRGERESLLDAAAFSDAPSISIDYAVMEKHDSVVAVPVDMGWNDVGDYRALWSISNKDDRGNVVMGPVKAVDCRNCYLRSEDDALEVSGLTDMIVVKAGGFEMTCRMDDAQSVKDIAARAALQAGA